MSTYWKVFSSYSFLNCFIAVKNFFHLSICDLFLLLTSKYILRMEARGKKHTIKAFTLWFRTFSETQITSAYHPSFFTFRRSITFLLFFQETSFKTLLHFLNRSILCLILVFCIFKFSIPRANKQKERCSSNDSTCRRFVNVLQSHDFQFLIS